MIVCYLPTHTESRFCPQFKDLLMLSKLEPFHENLRDFDILGDQRKILLLNELLFCMFFAIIQQLLFSLAKNRFQTTYRSMQDKMCERDTGWLEMERKLMRTKRVSSLCTQMVEFKRL